MKDLESRRDIAFLVINFYRNVKVDPLIGHFFNENTAHLEKHLPTMVSFWETIILGEKLYRLCPTINKVKPRQIFPSEEQHLERWLTIWVKTIYENFSGENSDEALACAIAIADVINYKTNQVNLTQSLNG